MFISVDLPAPFSPSRACTSPRRTSNETPSFATTPGNSLRMSRISRTRSSATGVSYRKTKRAGRKPALSQPIRALLLEDRRGLELARDDLRLVAVHQRDPRLRDLRADLADAHAVVLEVEEQVLAALEVALRGREDRVVDAHVRLLQSARQDPAGDAVLVSVDADAPLVQLRGLLEGSVTAEAGDLEDDLGLLALDLVLRDRRALGLVDEVARVLDDGLGALHCLRRAVLVARDVGVDRRDLQTPCHADDFVAHLLGHLRREDADEAAALLRRVGDALFILEPADVAHGIVGDRELGVRILLCVLLHRRTEQETGGDDDLRAVVHRSVVVRLIVARGVRHDRECRPAELLRRLLEPLQLVLVEPVVIEACDVAHERGLVAGLLRRVRLRAAKRAADGDRDSERGNACRKHPASNPHVPSLIRRKPIGPWKTDRAILAPSSTNRKGVG